MNRSFLTTTGLAVLMTLGTFGTALFAEEEAPAPAVAAAPEHAKAIAPGTKAPDPGVFGLDGTKTPLSAVLAGKPTVLVFYRGGWCPYCTAHLAELAKAEQALIDAGYQIVALSPDAPEPVKKDASEWGYSYKIFSDKDGAAATAFGVAFRLDDATYAKYKGFGVDLEERSGAGHHILPVPSVFLIDASGIVRFTHANADYKARLSGDKLLAAAKSAAPTTVKEEDAKPVGKSGKPASKPALRPAK